MDDGNNPRRPRARSEATGTRDDTRRSPFISRNRSTRVGDGDREFASPRRATVTDHSERDGSPGMRRLSSIASRRSGSGIPSLTRRTTLAERTQGKFTLAGPDETPQMRLAHEPFVHPGYTDLNPSYNQATNAKPVWSLAKPLPRVVRSGMVPTKDELLQNRANAQLPAENSQKLGLEVDPNHLEQGQIAKAADPRVMAAQVEDARLQRETNFMNKVLSGGVAPTMSGLSHTSSGRRRRPSAWGPPLDDQLSTLSEDEHQPEHSEELYDENHPSLSDEPLRPVPEEADVDEGVDTASLDILALKESAYPEDLHPLVQELVEDEIHNNHTTWSVIRTHHREALAESLAVFIQLTIGFCADLGVTLAKAGNPNTTDWAWGLATMIAIYISGGVSGAHLNPVISILLWFYRGFPQRKMPEYLAAQFIGAFCAALVAYGVYYDSIQHYLLTDSNGGIITSFVTSQRQPWVGPATAFFNEFLGSALLGATILALGDDQNAPPGAGMNSLIIGLVITCLSMTLGYQTGAAFNPSRDFGPRLALLALGYDRQLFTNPYWFYGPWAGAISGSLFGGLLYDFMIFTGGESPINYPLERTQRAMRKSRMKWKYRLNLGEKGAGDRIIL